MIFFFFQAEDGIRDRTVTGVQTCALPISSGAFDIVSHGGSENASPVPECLRDDPAAAANGFQSYSGGTADLRGIAPQPLLHSNLHWSRKGYGHPHDASSRSPRARARRFPAHGAASLAG